MNRSLVYLNAPEYENFKNVAIALFHAEGLSEEEYAELLPAEICNNAYARSAMDQTFSPDEVEDLEYAFSYINPAWTMTTEPVDNDFQHRIGVGALPIGSLQGYIRWQNSEGGEFFAMGYYDLRNAEYAGGGI